MENMLLDTSAIVFAIMLVVVLMITLGIFCVKALSYVERELKRLELQITYLKNMNRVIKETTEVIDSTLEEYRHWVIDTQEERSWEDGI